ncbi:MAG TPA: HAD-IA family hydrolase [Nitrospiraceae bacterium]|nr:HAD-IA family hydrolase [Nitrospiraceae bacterium]
MSQIQVIFFDAAGTLFRVKGSVAEVYLQYAEKYGVKRTSNLIDAINAAFARAFHDAPPPVFRVTDPSEIKQCERLWWFDIVHNVFYRIGMIDRFDDYFEEVFHAFDGPKHWVLYPETFGVLKELKSRGYELGIISNFDSRLFNVLRGLGLADLFNTVTISSLAHAAKPASQIFRLALEKHAADPDEAVHVGDSVRDDADGARLAGLHAVLLKRDASSGVSSPVPVIPSLEKLPATIAAL